MPRMVRITEEGLRGAMRDERYWRGGHPERTAFVGWVTRGWEGLYPRDAAPRAAVWVDEHERSGHTVSAHWRSAPSGGARPRRDPPGRRPDEDTRDDGEASGVVPTNWPWRMGRRLILRGPDRGGSGGPSRRGPRVRERWPDTQGRDRVDEIRRDPETRHEGVLQRDVDQWSRPGGEEGRARDIEAMRPVGEPEKVGPNRERYKLEDGRIVVSRPSTSAGPDGPPTIEIFEPLPDGTYRSTDKIRYPRGR